MTKRKLLVQPGIPVKEVTSLEEQHGFDNSRIPMFPSIKSIPSVFWIGKDNKWVLLADAWYHSRVKEYVPEKAANLDVDKAVSHINSIMTRLDIKPELRIVICAYLMSEWFESPKFKAKGLTKK